MAAKQAQTTTERKIVYLLPEQLKVRPAFNGRHFEPDVTDLIDSIVRTGRVMQNLTAVEVNPGKYELVFGHRRRLAALRVNEQKLTKDPILLPVEVQKVDLKSAFLQNLEENRQHKRTSAVDDAYNIKRLKEEYKVPDDDILKLYATDGKAKSPAWMLQRLKLLKLTDDQQRKVHNDELSADVGYFLADVAATEGPAAANDVLKEAETKAAERATQVAAAKQAEPTAEPTTTGKVHVMEPPAKGKAATKVATKGVTAKKVAAPTRAQRNPGKVTINDVTDAARKKGVAVAKAAPRTMKHVRELFQAYSGPGMGLHCIRFCNAFLEWVDADKSDEDMEKEFHKRFKDTAAGARA